MVHRGPVTPPLISVLHVYLWNRVSKFAYSMEVNIETGTKGRPQQIQETHHEMGIPERDVTCYLFTYLRLFLDIHRTGTASVDIYE